MPSAMMSHFSYDLAIAGRIEIRDIVTWAPGGNSGAVVALGIDGNRYIVKFRQNLQGNVKVLANDFVGSALACAASLPCSPPYIVDIDRSVMTRSSHLLSQRYTQQLPTEGTAFGCKEYKGAQSIIGQSRLVRQAANKTDAAGILLFDAWVANGDRATDGNALIYKAGPSRNDWKVVMVDHGHICTGPAWYDGILNQNRLVTMMRYPTDLVQTTLTRTDYLPYLYNIEAVTDDMIRAIVETVPREWLPRDRERAALVRFLTDRRNLVRSIIPQH